MAKSPSKPTKKSSSKVKASAKTVKAVKAPAVKSVKTPASKTIKTTAAKKAATSSSAKLSLQAKLDNVTRRLNTANNQTQKNITALKTDFSALAQQMGRTKAGQTRLTRRVTALSKTLTTDFETLQADIRRDLAGALSNPTIDSLQTALTRADERLTESEAVQSAAIARINRHIADIATAVEDRLSNEAQTREAAMAEMRRTIESGESRIIAAQAALEKQHETQTQASQLRFSNLQSESAEAIRSLGDKIVDVAEEMGRRRETLGAKLRQELSESTLSSNAEFEQFRRVVERRLEALESETRGFDTQIDRAIVPLTSRIEGLEYGLTQAPEPAQDQYAPNLQALPPALTLSSSTATSALSAPIAPANAAARAPNPSLQEDAFSQSPLQSSPVQSNLAPVEYEAETPLELNKPTVAQAVPYDPAAYKAVPQMVAPAAPAYAPQAQDPYSNPNHQQNPYGQQPAAPQFSQAQHETAPYDAPPVYTNTQPPFPPVKDLNIADSELPYADPAYAEGHSETPVQMAEFSDESMGAARPGAFESLKKIGRKAGKVKSANLDNVATSPLLTPRNLKVGALVAALGVASFMGVQTLKGGSSPIANNPEFSVAKNDSTNVVFSGDIPSQSQNAVNTPPTIDQETIGNYADNRKMNLVAGGENALNTAVKAGNPIAQLQLGLSQIENGQLESGVELIRASANQEQPAALYRLAKLYETGQGVGKDATTARQLTERAARGGNRIAMHDLALYHAEGRGGVDVQMPVAAKWFEKAAQRGVVDSQFNLGVLFESGQGLPQDMESALVWYSIGGAQGDQMAAGRVAVLRKTLSEDQIARADKRIASFKPSRIDEEANGIFNNVPWAQPSQVADNGAGKAVVIQTQTLLNELGYAVGAADGAIGPKTKNAILNFQRNNGMGETGVVNAELIERLENAAGV